MLHRIVKYARTLISAIGQHNTGVLAAVIAYFGFSSMIPLLLLVIYGGSIVIPLSYLNRFLGEFLQTYVPTVPVYKGLVLQTVTHLEKAGGTMSIIGFGGLIWNTVGGFVSFQYILDVIWGVRHRRGFIRQYVVGLIALLFLVTLTAASAVVDTVTPRVVSGIKPEAQAAQWFAVAHWTAQGSFPFFLLLTCYFCYRFLPSTALNGRILWLGSALATAAIYISHWLFLIYTQHLGNYTVIYGSLAFIMLLLFWIYIVSAIVLFTGEFMVTLDLVRGNAENAGKHSAGVGKRGA